MQLPILAKIVAYILPTSWQTKLPLSHLVLRITITFLSFCIMGFSYLYSRVDFLIARDLYRYFSGMNNSLHMFNYFPEVRLFFFVCFILLGLFLSFYIDYLQQRKEKYKKTGYSISLDTIVVIIFVLAPIVRLLILEPLLREEFYR